MQTPRLAYSYIRFSSEKQHLGDSLRRQVAMAEAYALANNMTLDTASYRDLGISAFRGRNAVEGKLAMFLRAVDGDLIPPNATLLVESLDRLSRNDVDDALNLFLSIIKRGVTIVTLSDGQVYSTKTIKSDRGISLIISITIMMRAHEESMTKAMRCTEAWRARTARGGILTKRCPSWIVYDDGKWRIDRARAAVVRRIYRLYLAGDGCYRIHRRLNQEGVPTLRHARHWTTGLVTDLLRTPAVYGTMSRMNAPDIENYYPAVISREDFERSQLLAKARSTATGIKSVQPANVFMGVSRCGGCGSRMQIVGGTGRTYYLCCGRSNSEAGCDAARVACKVAEKALFQDLLSPKHLSKSSAPAQTQAAAMVVELEAAQTAHQATLDKLIQLALATANAGSVAKRIVTIEERMSEGARELAVQRKLASPRRSEDLEKARQLCAALTGDHVDAAEANAMRQALKPLTRRLFAGIEFHPSRREMTLTYASGLRSVATYEALLQGFQKGHGGVARWGRTQQARAAASDLACTSS